MELKTILFITYNFAEKLGNSNPSITQSFGAMFKRRSNLN